MCLTAATIRSFKCSMSPANPGQEGAAVDQGRGRHVGRPLFHPLDLQGPLFPGQSGGGGLPLGEGVEFVVVDEDRDVGVSPDGMEEMVSPLAVAVPVAVVTMT